MGVGSISFWQQDQNYWNRSQAQTQSLAQSDSLITVMANAMTAQSQGLASIANQTALDRVNTQLTAAVQSALQGTTSSSTAPSSTSSSSSSDSSTSTSPSTQPVPAAPATGTGTAPVLTSTSLFTLGILAKGQITVSDGTNTTFYKSTGTDTVGDLINAINANVFGNANVAAGLNANGQLVLTAKDNTSTIIVGGAYAPNIGFGGSNDTFLPTAPTPSASSAASSSSSSSNSAASGSGSSTPSASTPTSSGIASNSAFALQTGGTAALLLASNGGAGSLVNLLA
ncbi:MAG TPA: hypothetical protein VK337_08720 [Xanthobacteraceae bacterium]|nr:hypothetical protein [Xanthobacteraceae bacterium]